MILPPPTLRARLTEPPKRILRNRDAERLRLALLWQSYPPEPVEPEWCSAAWANLVIAAIAFVFIALCSGCELELPENPLRDPVPSWIPEPGARPEAFECTLAGVTASGDEPHWTRFEGDRFEPVRVYSEDAITDVELGGVSVIVVGDVFVVGGQWIRLGEC